MKEAFTGESAQTFFCTDYLVELLDEHRADRADNSRKIWTVYVFLLWYKIFFESQGNIDYNRKRTYRARG